MPSELADGIVKGCCDLHYWGCQKFRLLIRYQEGNLSKTPFTTLTHYSCTAPGHLICCNYFRVQNQIEIN